MLMDKRRSRNLVSQVVRYNIHDECKRVGDSLKGPNSVGLMYVHASSQPCHDNNKPL